MLICGNYYRAGMAIVGNSGTMLGSGDGPAIDAAATVVRFNRCDTTGHEADLGRKLTIWITSGWDSEGTGWHPSGHELTCLAMPALHPDYRDRYRFDPAVVPLGIPYLQIPVGLFREVAAVCPNPSSGVAFCYWLWCEIGGPLDRNCLYGFSHFAPDRPYHWFSDERPETTTHNGAAEEKMFATMCGMRYTAWRALR